MHLIWFIKKFINDKVQYIDEVVDKGLVRHLAVSNFTLERLQQAKNASNHPIVAGQYHLNLMYREPERKGILEYCQTHDTMFIAWRPVQKGTLSSENQPLLADLSKKYGKTPSQIAINWLISQKNIVTLSKMGNPAHLDENLHALGWNLEETDIKKLSEEFPGQQDVSNAVPLI